MIHLLGHKKLTLALLTFGLACSCLPGQQNQGDDVINDEDIAVLRFEEMHYPLRARLDHTQGIVVLRVKLDDAGKVVAAQAMSGAKHLIPDSVANAKKWMFRPNRQKAAIIIYEFRIEGACYTGMNGHFIFREPNFVSVRGCELVVTHGAQPGSE